MHIGGVEDHRRPLRLRHGLEYPGFILKPDIRSSRVRSGCDRRHQQIDCAVVIEIRRAQPHVIRDRPTHLRKLMLSPRLAIVGIGERENTAIC